MLQWLRSLAFITLMYLAMVVMGILGLPYAMISRDKTRQLIRIYANFVRWSAHHVAGLRSEIRGPVPQDEVVVASKHQSFFDILMLLSVLPRPKFIMKAELKYAPILGFYALRIGCIPVDRGKRGQAIQKMRADVSAGRAEPGQLVIFPQGTRVAPGVDAPYKVGVGVIYEALEQDCVPAATNVGVFWPRRGIYRRPGTAVLEFLPRIPAGKRVPELMAELAPVIETRSEELRREALNLPQQG